MLLQNNTIYFTSHIKASTPSGSSLLIFIVFSFFCMQASQTDIKTVIVHMPGTLDGGFFFLNNAIQMPQKFDFSRRYSNSLNPKKKFYDCSQVDISGKTLIYSNNIPLNQMDLGGPRCVEFYKKMILRAHFLYTNADVMLVGASQGSVGPFGALAELIQEDHPVIPKIKRVLIEAALGSTHETINYHAQKIPLLKILPRISTKIAPLVAEYMPRFMPGFACYDAFAPQMYHYIQEIKNSGKANHIKFLILHDTGDEIIPCSCAQKAAALLDKNIQYTETTVNAALYFSPDQIKKGKIPFLHLPSNASETWAQIISFLRGQKPESIQKKTIDQKIDLTIDSWFISKTPPQRFAIRRIRDFIALAALFVSYKTIKCIVQSISFILKKNR